MDVKVDGRVRVMFWEFSLGKDSGFLVVREKELDYSLI